MAAFARPARRVLVIEDDASLNEIVCTFLEQEGFACTPAFSGTEARMLLEQADRARDAAERDVPAERSANAAATPLPAFDLVITDLMLPGLPGEEFVPVVRERLGNVPVIVTSAKGAVSDRVALLRTGADDYLVKPFDLEELLARIDVQLRLRGAGAGQGQGQGQGAPWQGPAGSPGTTVPNAADAAESSDALTFGAWRLNPATRSFAVNGTALKLTRTEFDLVEALMRQPERVFSKRDLYRAACHNAAAQANAVAGAYTSSDEKTVSTHVGNLRAKLKATGTDSYLETVWGIGFKLRRPQA